MSVKTGTTALFRVANVEPATNECGSFACEATGIITNPDVMTSIVFIGITLLVALAYRHTASEVCRNERQRVLNEHDAFEEFADRIEALDPISTESSAAVASGSSTRIHETIGIGGTADVTVQQVLSIYRETVMSVPHYEVEYDETVPESISAELGPDAVASLATNKALLPPAQRALVNRGREAAAARMSLADAIAVELNALSDANTELTAIDRRRRQLMEHLMEIEGDRTDAAIDIWNQLENLEDKAEAVAIERQQNLREPPMQVDHAIWDADEMVFYEYLYNSTDSPRHPVLLQVTDLIATIREDRDRIVTQVADGR